MDQPPTDTPPPARPAPTRETVGALAQVLTHLIQASYEQSYRSALLHAAILKIARGDIDGAKVELECAADQDRVVAGRLDKALSALQHALQRFAGEHDA